MFVPSQCDVIDGPLDGSNATRHACPLDSQQEKGPAPPIRPSFPDDCVPHGTDVAQHWQHRPDAKGQQIEVGSHAQTSGGCNHPGIHPHPVSQQDCLQKFPMVCQKFIMVKSHLTMSISRMSKQWKMQCIIMQTGVVTCAIGLPIGRAIEAGETCQHNLQV
jgi:hypothetical protein